ncbi:hypothetical protein ACIA5C_48310 [Actinoplanes sp. NPDC051343]|uniref:hypothetical protein n=1 Tax=Actinoplanes sp. NPDC051343 TaxID=3363906 RepID=UPI0037B04345
MVAFDLLRAGRGAELLDQPLSRRRSMLERLLAGAPTQIAVCPQTASRTVTQRFTATVAPIPIKRANRATLGCANPYLEQNNPVSADAGHKPSIVTGIMRAVVRSSPSSTARPKA